MAITTSAIAPQDEIASRDHVLTTTELLESVLSFLPMKDLLFAQHVCKTWKTCIEKSPTLQRGLFFMPIGPPRAEHLILIGNEHMSIRRKKEFRNPARNQKLFESTYKNPLMWSLLPCGITDRPYWGGEFTSHVEYIDRAEASWRRMLLFQPPIPAVLVREGDHDKVTVTDKQFGNHIFREVGRFGRWWENSRDLVY